MEYVKLNRDDKEGNTCIYSKGNMNLCANELKLTDFISVEYVSE